MKTLLSALIVVALIAAAPAAAQAAASTPATSAPASRPVSDPALIDGRPRLKLAADSAEISFAVREFTDVVVEVVNPQGQVIRHLAAGVLGEKAPAPFQKNSKAQTIVWNLKDDQGQPVDPKSGAKVLIRAGLRPAFDRTFGWSGQTIGVIKGMTVDKDGNLYVTSKSMPITYRIHTYTKVFDRAGKYLRTINPFPANLPEDKLKGILFADLPDGRRIPMLKDVWERDTHGLGIGMHQPVVTRDGKLLFPNFEKATGPAGGLRVSAIGIDGSVEADFMGPQIAKQEPPYDQAHQTQIASRAYLAASPDERYLYVSGISRGYREPRPEGGKNVAGRDNCVYRLDRQGKEPPAPFIGKKFYKDGTLDNPLGLDVDAAGNIYVCDYGHNRVAVFSPAGELKHELAIERPVQVAVHPAGQVYVYSCEGLKPDDNINRVPLTHRLTRFGGKDKPAAEARIEWPKLSATIQLTMALDKTADKPIVWIGAFTGQNGNFWYKGVIRKVVDEGQEFKDLGDVITGQNAEPDFGRDHKFMLVDPRTEEVWWDYMIFDGNTGKLLRKFQAEGAGRFLLGTPGRFAGEPKLGPDNTVLIWGGGGLARFTRDGKPRPYPGGSHQVKVENFRGHAGRNFVRGLDVDEQGNAYVLGSAGYAESKKTGLVIKIDNQGKLTRDLVLLEESVSGLSVGRGGALYVGLHVQPFGHALPAHWEQYFKAHPNAELQGAYTDATGSVIKFAPAGGSIRLDPAGQDFQSFRSRETNRFKAAGVEWSASNNSAGGKCNCEVTSFDVDGHNRLFVPDPLTYSVAVLDENGNLITRFGQYGTMDSGGPGSLVPVPEIPLSYAFRLAVSDKAVYISDGHAQRALKVKLDYRATAELTWDGN